MKKPHILPAIVLVASFALPSAAPAEVDFATQIAPILDRHCVECHGPTQRKGRLRLHTPAEIALSEGVVVPGKAEESELIARVILPVGDDDRMPPEGDPLTEEQQNLLRAWINEGAKWPEGLALGPKEAEPARVIEWPPDRPMTASEQQAVEQLNRLGLSVRPIAMNSAWLTANLRVFGGDFNDELFTRLGQAVNLVDLNLASTAVTDAHLAKLAGLKHLMVLHLPNTQVTDAGLRHLAGMEYLHSLNLYGTAVTDAGLEHLHGLKRLRKLYLWQTQVTPEGVAKLQAALPEADINTGASLAVAAEPEAEEKKEY